MKTYSLSLIEGKCFVVEKELVASGDLTDHFYCDLWAPKLNVRCLEDLSILNHRKLAVCKPCLRTAKEEQENVRAYIACNAPLKTMELFSGQFPFPWSLVYTLFLPPFVPWFIS